MTYRTPTWPTAASWPIARSRPRPARRGVSVVPSVHVTAPQVVLLGTGDPLNHERAQASLALQLVETAAGAGGGETLLIDTSSGVVLLRQLHAAGIVLALIRHIFISHRHFDHAGGLAPLLVALSAIPEATVTVYAPPVTRAALHNLLAMSIPGVEEWMGGRLRWRTLIPGRAVAAGRVVVTPFAVAHGLECVGFRAEAGGATIVFSADTRPCPALVAYATGADLLIHEAYGLNTTAAEAHRFGHATAQDAGCAARAADAGHLVLTHLRGSLHADPAALASEAATVFDGPVTPARDLDVVHVRPPPTARASQ